ncbi:phosphotransferase [Pseudomonas chlororaphis]|uniref:phosphotransferase n=1 Tax=Pseudomonas chlororaphis TaxID=587753 RepID=UPI0015DEA13A|nr:phosphotransferase [Pseudomonas chlororaphis]QLL10745.1 phosphotransferase [Pseudomonas chlororaphis subsp. aurantiaca]
MSNGQDEVIAFLSRPSSYDASNRPVERIETHGSVIFLHADRAYKLKRAVAFAELDFLSLESRRNACQAELLLNRRTAPRLYLGLCPINRRENGQLALNGRGPVVDWLVVMRRFAQERLFDRMAIEGRLTESLMEQLGAEIARFHASAQITLAFGHIPDLYEEIEKNHREMCRYREILDMATVSTITRASQAMLNALVDCLESRRREGRVRRCHGDMRLANICLIDNRPTLFDGIEFSERIACIDVLYDLAFVLMDLQHHGLPRLGARLLSSYLQHSVMMEDCRPLSFFLALRAATRCFSLASGALRHVDPAKRYEKKEQAIQLMHLALAYLQDENLRHNHLSLITASSHV